MPHGGDTYGEESELDKPNEAVAATNALREAAVPQADAAVHVTVAAKGSSSSEAVADKAAADPKASMQQQTAAAAAGAAPAASDDDALAAVTDVEEAMMSRVLDAVVSQPAMPSAKPRIDVVTAKPATRNESSQAADTPAVDSRAQFEGERSQAGAKEGSGIIQTQVFVRHVPLDATKIELQAKMQQFGDVKACRCTATVSTHRLCCCMACCLCVADLLYHAVVSKSCCSVDAWAPSYISWPHVQSCLCCCRVVINKATGKPKGTAFVEFANGAAAAKAVAASKALQAGAGPGLSLKGKQLDIAAALVQDKARSLAQEQSGFTASKDKRNLYLVRMLASVLPDCMPWDAKLPPRCFSPPADFQKSATYLHMK